MAEKIIVAGTVEGGVWSKSLEQHKRVYDTSGIAPALTAGGGGNMEKKITEPTTGTICGSKQEHCSVRTDGICPTLTEAMGMGGGQIPMHNYDCRIRKLTPRECFRLMNFDDEDFDKAKAAGVSDSQLYKQAGNSIVVAVLEAIFKQML